MNLNLDDEQTRALLNLILEAIDADRYPLSPRAGSSIKAMQVV